MGDEGERTEVFKWERQRREERGGGRGGREEKEDTERERRERMARNGVDVKFYFLSFCPSPREMPYAVGSPFEDERDSKKNCSNFSLLTKFFLLRSLSFSLVLCLSLRWQKVVSFRKDGFVVGQKGEKEICPFSPDPSV